MIEGTEIPDTEDNRQVLATIVALRNALQDRFRRRLTAARMIHPFLLGERGRILLGVLGRLHIIPFGPISRLLK